MRIAVIISGRATRYNECLLPILEKTHYDVDLYVSINDSPCQYYEVMKNKLLKWLKGVYISPYIIPEGFENEFIDDDKHCYQYINNKWVPRNQLSMYWNDRNAFSMATAYADNNGFEYDAYMRFRADIFNTSFPDIDIIEKDKLVLYSIYPQCIFESYGIYKRSIISSDWVWGNRKTMAVYCNTYDYVLELNKTMDYKYIFHFESNHTDNTVHNKIDIRYVNIEYSVDRNRKIFDINYEQLDSRRVNCIGALPAIDIKSLTSCEDIQPIAQ
jgi:hypothetical protein